MYGMPESAIVYGMANVCTDIRGARFGNVVMHTADMESSRQEELQV